jgi:PP-loop superfamily ATP-utilizing enzyme
MREAVGSNMLAIIADSPSLARTQLADAIAFAKEQGIPLEVISTSELDRPEYARNDGQRCFHCKDELFMAMEELRVARGFDTIAYGVNRPPCIMWPRRSSKPGSRNPRFASWRGRLACASGTSRHPPVSLLALNTAVPSPARR